MIGRDEEVRSILDAAAQAARGEGRVLVIEGEAGIGKTRLVGEALTAAQPLIGRAVPASHPVPYRPFAEALMAVERAGAASAGRTLDPLLSPIVAGETVLRVLRDRAGRGGPGILVLEDLHWADEQTLASVEYLADSLAREPVLVVAALRAEEASPAQDMVQRLAARHAVDRLDLGRLSGPDIARICDECLGGAPAAVGDYVRHYADGIPRLVEELLGTLLSSGGLRQVDGVWVAGELPALVIPGAFGTAVTRRLAALGPDERRVVSVAAALGRRSALSLLSLVSGFPENRLADLVARLSSAYLLVERHGTVEFRHTLTREAVLTSLPAGERELLASAALTVLESAEAQSGDIAESMAGLATLARQPARGAYVLLTFARRARACGAPAPAEIALTRARELAVDPETIDQIDEETLAVLASWRARGSLVRVHVSRLDQAVELGRHLALRLEAGNAPPERRARIQLAVARAHLGAKRWEQAAANAAQARRLDPRGRLRQEIDLIRADIAIGRDRHREAERLAQAAFDTDPEHPLAGEALLILGRARRPNDADRARDAFARALAFAERRSMPDLIAGSLNEIGTLDLLRNGTPDALEQARGQAFAIGAVVAGTVAQFNLVVLHLFRHELDRAESRAAELLDLAHRHRMGPLEYAASIARAAVAASRGDDISAVEELLRHVPEALKADPEWSSLIWGHCYAVAAINRDDSDAARLALRHAHGLMQIPDPHHSPVPGLLTLLSVVAGEDYHETVRTLLQDPDRLSHAAARGPALAACAIREARQGNRARANVLLREAFGTLAATPWFQAVTVRHVAASDVGPAWPELAPYLQHARGFFEAAALGTLAQACAGTSAAHATRAAPRAGVPFDLKAAGVTARELEVAGLVIRGLSNREIAQHLFLSPRTIDKHVERLLQKMGCPNRTALALRLTPFLPS
ncbi:hypothetical protein Acor_07840 [Acrocarpospora corrugata]|uniref:HTH luxR-type domain-containing protein n=1 Tax=Acrocarpospora corrugata TaxID=35763 RepID=A0A5M3VSX0_9ACTN|nr:LuxR family transcriptional regulator [Acrocarpospora corrugata]GER98721.1 hypothetical protein Acor_07840 [Acrocarpospora corrugata]